MITDDSVESRPLDHTKILDYASPEDLALENGVLRSDAPFQIILLSYDPALAAANQITIMAPNRYIYVETEQGSFQMHQHNTFELVYIREGTLYQRIESERHIYPAGSFMLLNRNVRHCEEYDTAFSTVSLSLSADYFKALLKEDRDQVFRAGRLWGDNSDLKEFLSSELLGTGNPGKNYIDFIPQHPQLPDADPVRELFEQMTRIMLNPKPGEVFFFRGYICQLLNLLCRRELFTTKPIALGTQSESRIFAQINQLFEAGEGRVSREMLVKELRYSGNYLNRIVQTFTGMNITQYSMYYTLKRAAWMLANTNTTVTEIIGVLGFSNRTYFYSEFQKHYGETPREYRIHHRK